MTVVPQQINGVRNTTKSSRNTIKLLLRNQRGAQRNKFGPQHNQTPTTQSTWRATQQNLAATQSIKNATRRSQLPAQLLGSPLFMSNIYFIFSFVPTNIAFTECYPYVQGGRADVWGTHCCY